MKPPNEVEYELLSRLDLRSPALVAAMRQAGVAGPWEVVADPLGRAHHQGAMRAHFGEPEAELITARPWVLPPVDLQERFGGGLPWWLTHAALVWRKARPLSALTPEPHSEPKPNTWFWATATAHGSTNTWIPARAAADRTGHYFIARVEG